MRRESFVEVEVWFLQRELKGNKFDPQDFDALGHEAEEGNECAFKPLHESVRLRIISKFESGLFYDSLSLSLASQASAFDSVLTVDRVEWISRLSLV